LDRRTILVADDDPDVRLSLAVRLKANDYEAILAEDGPTSVAQALERKPDLIILDLGLPAGDGINILKSLQATESLSAIPVIVISGRDRKVYKDLALEAGAKAFLQKPVDNSMLLSMIRQVLNEA
jgi:DNA-binding response OmpR family regulator